MNDQEASLAREARTAYYYALHGEPEYPGDGTGEPPPQEMAAWDAVVSVIAVRGSEYKAAREWEERYRNALSWIRMIASMHYLGGAFEPEHMRSLGNVAANALDGKDLPDFEESTAKARKKAAKWAERFGREMAEQEAGE